MLGRRGSDRGGDWDQILEERGCALPSEPPKQLQTRTLGAASRRSSSVILSRITRLSARCWHLRLSVLGSLLAQPIFPQGPLLLLGLMPFPLCRAGPLARRCRVSPSHETHVSQLQCPPQRCPPALLPVTGQREKYNMGVGGAPQTIWSFPIYCRRVSGARWPEWVKTLSKGHIARQLQNPD